MKKTKFNPELLKEELNRFKLINEYSFYKEADSYNDDESELLFGSDSQLDEADEEIDGPDAIANDLGVTSPNTEPENDTPEPNPANMEEPEIGSTLPTTIEEPEDDEVELDVTDLVDSTDEAKNAADKASQNSQLLIKKLEDLESRIASMDAVSDKIEALEKEIVKRNPTNVEKLEMQSLHSDRKSVV